MKLHHRDPRLSLLTAVFFAVVVLAFSLSAKAVGPLESAAVKPTPILTEYEVKQGDTLGEIALELGFALVDLMEANGLDNPDQVLAGQMLRLPGNPKFGRVTKGGVLARVPKGFSLSLIAAAYEVPVKTLVSANKLNNPNMLRENQMILIPGAKMVIELVPPPPCFKDPVTLYRVRNDRTEKVPLCFCNGRPNPKGIEVLSDIAGPVGKKPPFPMHPRVVKLLQKISERFPGKRIEIISGQRVAKQKSHESYHNKGQALDFRLQGISRKKLYRFVRTFKNVGAGYYPKSVFIHMDVRDSDAYWIDYSGSGEKSIYGRAGMSEREIDKIRARRRQPEIERTTADLKAAVDKAISSIKSSIES